MRFLVDAQLPRHIARRLSLLGHDAIHTRDLPLENTTVDNDLIRLAVEEDRIVFTKDKDFYYSYLLKRRPPKLLLLTIGNITNRELRRVLETYLSDILLAFESNSFVELTRNGLIVHE